MKLHFLIITFFSAFSVFGQAAQPTAKPFTVWQTSDICKVCSEEVIEGKDYRIINDEYIYLAFYTSYVDDYYIANVYLTNKSKQFIFNPLKDTGLLTYKTEKGYFDQTEKSEVFLPVEESEIEKKLRYGNAGVNLSEALTAPNKQEKERIEEQARKNRENTLKAINIVADSAFKAKTLSTNDKIVGKIYYPRKKKSEVLSFNFGLQGRVYSFIYLMGKNKK